jgi:hypothetical protein
VRPRFEVWDRKNVPTPDLIFRVVFDFEGHGRKIAIFLVFGKPALPISGRSMYGTRWAGYYMLLKRGANYSSAFNPAPIRTRLR